MRGAVAVGGQAQPSSLKSIIVGMGKGAKGRFGSFVLGGCRDGSSGKWIVDRNKTMVEELCVDGRYAGKEGIVRAGLLYRRKPARRAVCVRAREFHGR